MLKEIYPKPFNKRRVSDSFALFLLHLPSKLLFKTGGRTFEVPDFACFNEYKRTVRKLSRVLYVRNRVLKTP